MTFNDATISFDSIMTASCSQFRIHFESAIEMTVSGPSRYIYLKLNEEQIQVINALAEKVGIRYENGPKRNNFMVYSGTFCPNQVKGVDNSCEASSEEKRAFGQIFDIARTSIATQMGWSVNPSDVTRIILEKTVDFSYIEAQRACMLSIALSQSAADRLEMDKDSRLREYDKGGSYNAVMKMAHAGQF